MASVLLLEFTTSQGFALSSTEIVILRIQRIISLIMIADETIVNNVPSWKTIFISNHGRGSLQTSVT